MFCHGIITITAELFYQASVLMEQRHYVSFCPTLINVIFQEQVGISIRLAHLSKCRPILNMEGIGSC